MKIVLAGNPNAGKTTLFNALTHGRLPTGNWHGVTTRPASKVVRGVTYTDVPGMYSFNGFSMEEASAAEGIRSADAVINVVDGLTLEQSLSLTQTIISMNGRVIVYVTKLKQLKRRGGRLNAEKLSAILGVPVATEVRQLKALIKNLPSARAGVREDCVTGVGYGARGGSSADFVARGVSGAELGRGGNSGAYVVTASNSSTRGGSGVSSDTHVDYCARQISKSALAKAYYAGNCALTKAEKLFYNRAFALAFFVFAVLAMFFVAFFPHMPGEALKSLTEWAITEKLGGAVRANLAEGKFQSFVCDGIIGGAGGVLAFVPQLVVLYLFLTLLDESGIMSALSFVTDGAFRRAGLSGRAAFSLISGFGCTAAAISTTRGFSSRGAQLKTVAVLAYIPCGAKMPVFLTLLSPLFSDPFPVLCALYFAGVTLALAISVALKGKGEEMLSEVTPIAFPAPSAVFRKLFFYIKGFIIKVATAVLVFCVVSWVLSNYTFTLRPCGVEESMLAAISRAALPLFVPMGIKDWRLAYAMISGFAAKENIAATISMLMPAGTGLDMASGLAAAVFVLACPACVSAFSAACREVGVKSAAKIFSLQLAGAFALAYIVRLAAVLL